MHPKAKTFCYYRYFFNFIYYLGLCPYRVVVVSKSQPYIVAYDSFQKGFCAIFHLVLCFASLTMFWGSFINQEEQLPLNLNPMRLFYIARATGFPLYVFTFFYCIWFRKEKFFYLLHLVLTPDRNHVHKVSTRIVVTTIAVCFIALAFAPFHMLGEDYFYRATEWDFRNSFPQYAGLVAHNLFLHNTTAPLEPSQLTPGMTVLVLAAGVINVYLVIVVHMADSAVLIGALALRRMGKDFSTLFALSKGMNSERLIKNYGNIKGIVDNVNQSTGPLVVCMFFVTMPYFVENLVTLFVPNLDPFLKIRFLYYAIHYFAIMIIASSGNRVLTESKTYLFKVVFRVGSGGGTANNIEYNHGLSPELQADEAESLNTDLGNNNWKLVILYLEAAAANLGLKGCGFFTITYGFLGSIVGILLTYFIVRVQFKIPDGNVAVPQMPSLWNCTFTRMELTPI